MHEVRKVLDKYSIYEVELGKSAIHFPLDMLNNIIDDLMDAPDIESFPNLSYKIVRVNGSEYKSIVMNLEAESDAQNGKFNLPLGCRGLFNR